ncbi:hypothetical protein EDD37DRAFT_139375 [Exophiala viscosa]|uniref:Essential protein Yae1 N-terminal domain-containing protein n=1 Tax=Exophiala viscosa TaxID=2486360 RepID=A0AAN6DQT8_9EURO|nr:hypothetical protein EDD36DRAFT_84377 [Exophiala viscosa]KAI1620952.1 hypothetical protein EDD37DRAFT_139375 [Exophiala viscosa]
MASDPFDDLLELENEYYKEGYDAGVADSTYAGMIEGKVFGVEKGYEKAAGLGRLHGRALVWQTRLSQSAHDKSRESDVQSSSTGPTTGESERLASIVRILGGLPSNTRLGRHIDALSSVTAGASISKDNSDESVSEFDDRITRASAKAKVVSNIVGEALNPVSMTNSGIEDATGLEARH